MKKYSPLALLAIPLAASAPFLSSVPRSVVPVAPNVASSVSSQVLDSVSSRRSAVSLEENLASIGYVSSADEGLVANESATNYWSGTQFEHFYNSVDPLFTSQEPPTHDQIVSAIEGIVYDTPTVSGDLLENSMMMTNGRVRALYVFTENEAMHSEVWPMGDGLMVKLQFPSRGSEMPRRLSVMYDKAEDGSQRAVGALIEGRAEGPRTYSPEEGQTQLGYFPVMDSVADAIASRFTWND